MSSAEPPAEGSASSAQSHRRPPRRRPPKSKQDGPTQATSGVEADGTPIDSPSGSNRPPRNPRQQQPRAPRQPSQPRDASQQEEPRPQKPRNQRNQKKKDDLPTASAPSNSRRSNFRGKLTSDDSQSVDGPSTASDKYRTNLPQGDDLTSSLIRSLSTPPYPDCPICFVSIHPAQPTWSCSPSIPVILSGDGPAQYCWTSFHTKCIKAWAAKSVKEVAEAWRARGEHDKSGDWRCPGCQAKREIVPSGYRYVHILPFSFPSPNISFRCFCGAVPEPKLTRLSTPHSCGRPCTRVRETGCGHPCPLLCHPGPCPPCQVVTQLDCYCPRHISLSFRCGVDSRNLSCGNVCDRLLKCGKHSCKAVCHEGDCEKCPLKEIVKCYCGKEEKEVDCGEGTPAECFVEGEAPWIGRYTCDRECQR